MSTLNIPFSSTWTLRTPAVIRIMELAHVDAFFDSGSLRISSFEKFRQHPDELRRDEEEGRAAMEITSPNSRTSALVLNGQEAYVLCASTVKPAPEQGPGLGGLVINDTVAFAWAVSRQLRGFVGGMEGSCIYRHNTLYRATEKREFAPPEEGEDPEQWANDQDRIIGQHMQNKFFIKHAKFAHEAEYRMIWFCSGAAKDYIDVECPDAIKSCQRLRI